MAKQQPVNPSTIYSSSSDTTRYPGFVGAGSPGQEAQGAKEQPSSAATSPLSSVTAAPPTGSQPPPTPAAAKIANPNRRKITGLASVRSASIGSRF